MEDALLELPIDPSTAASDPADPLDLILKESRKLREQGEQVLQASSWELGNSKTEKPQESLLPVGTRK